jgi:hypothetical protein
MQLVFDWQVTVPPILAGSALNRKNGILWAPEQSKLEKNSTETIPFSVILPAILLLPTVTHWLGCFCPLKRTVALFALPRLIKLTTIGMAVTAVGVFAYISDVYMSIPRARQSITINEVSTLVYLLREETDKEKIVHFVICL